MSLGWICPKTKNYMDKVIQIQSLNDKTLKRDLKNIDDYLPQK